MTSTEREDKNEIETFTECEKAVWVMGYGGAGKSTLSKLLNEEFGFTRIELGLQVFSSYQEYAAVLLEPDNFLDWLRRELINGESYFTKRLLARHLRENPDDVHAKKVVIPSMRTLVGLRAIQKQFPHAKHTLIYVKASQEMRASRIVGRKSPQPGDYGLQALQERDNMEDEFGILEVISVANVEIENEGNLEEFKERIRNTFRRKLKNV